jgi:hypothetical protein
MPRTRGTYGGVSCQLIREGKGLARRGRGVGAQAEGRGRCHSRGLAEVVLLRTDEMAGFGYPTASATEDEVACGFQRLTAYDGG